VHSSLEDSKNVAAATESAENQAAQQEATPSSTQETAPPAAEAAGAETEEQPVDTAAAAANSEAPASGDSSDTKSASEAPNLSPDMRKFLSFAGNYFQLINFLNCGIKLIFHNKWKLTLCVCLQKCIAPC